MRLGPSAFSSPGVVASTKKHEATHADQAAEGRWPRGAVERHDAEIEAYGREIISADTIGLSNEEREEVQRRLHYHLGQKKAALINEIRSARASMDTNRQKEELDKISGKIKDVQKYEKKGDEKAAVERKNDAIKELDDLIKRTKGEAKDTLEKLRDHIKELKEAELFVIKADIIENLRDARDADTATQGQRDEINKIIAKIKKLIQVEKKKDEKEALKIKKDALKEINDLLKQAKDSTKENLEKAKKKVEQLIKIEVKIPKIFVPRFKLSIGYLYARPLLEKANENLEEMNHYYGTQAPSMQTGTGYNGRVIYMLSPNFGLGGGWESVSVAKVSDSIEEEMEGTYYHSLVSWETSMNGPYAVLLLCHPGTRFNLNLTAQAGSYTAKYKREGKIQWGQLEEIYEKVEGEGRGVGYKASLGLEFNLSSGLSLFVEGGYRNLVITAEGDVLISGTEAKETEEMKLDFSGSELKAGIIVKF